VELCYYLNLLQWGDCKFKTLLESLTFTSSRYFNVLINGDYRKKMSIYNSILLINRCYIRYMNNVLRISLQDSHDFQFHNRWNMTSTALNSWKTNPYSADSMFLDGYYCWILKVDFMSAHWAFDYWFTLQRYETMTISKSIYIRKTVNLDSSF